MPEASVDSIITDPPYGLEFMGKEWDKLGAYQGPRIGEEKAHPAARKNRVRYGSSAASMQSWHEAWARVALRVAKPGAILMAFGGTRTFHRLACAVEDAGWEIRDTMMWLQGQGFAKGINIAFAFEHELCERVEIEVDGRVVKQWVYKDDGELARTEPPFRRAEADTWYGWNTALKPAWEPILVAMKPLDGTFAGNAVEHGVAGLWIDGGRVGTEERTFKGMSSKQPDSAGTFRDDNWQPKEVTTTATGRWPANIVLSHSPDCVLVGTTPDPGYVINRFVDGAKPFGDGAGHDYESEAVPGGEREVWACVPGCPVRMLDEQSGSITSKPGKPRKSKKPGRGYGMTHTGAEYADSGGASRYFKVFQGKDSECTRGGTSVSQTEDGIGSGGNQGVEKSTLNLRVDSSGSKLSGQFLQSTISIIRMANKMIIIFPILSVLNRAFIETCTVVSEKIIERLRASSIVSVSVAENGSALIHTNDEERVPIRGTVKIVSATHSESGVRRTGNITTNICESIISERKSPCRFFYTAKSSSTERLLGCPPGFANRHPTVKPIDLCRYLCRLTKTPTGGVVLDPFSGSGSIAVAALLEGRDAVAIELEEESARATVTRVEAALKYDDKLQSLKRFRLPGRRAMKRVRRERSDP